MVKTPLKLNIAYLYPDFLQGFCDKSNLEVFKRRAQERNIIVEIEEIRNDDKINPSKYDFYYISGSNIEALPVCNEHIKRNLEELHKAADYGIPMLAVYCGYILFGKEFQMNNTPLCEALGILGVKTRLLQNPSCNKISGKCNFINGNIVGYARHQADIVLLNKSHPLINLKSKTEGCVYKNVIGTNITSPLFAQNPHLCDLLITKCLKNRYKCIIPLAGLVDDIEWYSHNYILEAK